MRIPKNLQKLIPQAPDTPDPRAAGALRAAEDLAKFVRAAVDTAAERDEQRAKDLTARRTTPGNDPQAVDAEVARLRKRIEVNKRGTEQLRATLEKTGERVGRVGTRVK